MTVIVTFLRFYNVVCVSVSILTWTKSTLISLYIEFSAAQQLQNYFNTTPDIPSLSHATKCSSLHFPIYTPFYVVLYAFSIRFLS